MTSQKDHEDFLREQLSEIEAELGSVSVTRFYNVRRADEYQLLATLIPEFQQLMLTDSVAADDFLQERGLLIAEDRPVEIDPEIEMLDFYIEEED